ncbi:hypothetical protein ESA94_03755 [Lacibacter luteus]|uniref:Uncharacterized protein n=1 Tax=Lacibacter luteus TaxID=2508719 RepID=A0A4Q1CMA5_9BACT|nr:hypothetical protein [Lacibacter luteus]RXK62140.1 hypothetical protein ESA94_03755 [Lacibacter luteus]
MKISILPYTKMLYCILLIALLLPLRQQAQITSYQYRHVPANKVDEFIKRETTYWSKVAQKAVDAKKMSFWALLEKVGGYDLPNSSNYLFINTFPNIDSAWSSGVFDITKVFPAVPYSQMETGSFTTVTSQLFLHDEDWVEAKAVNPAKDFNYVVMNYHLSNDAQSFINAEKNIWKPFLQTAMDKKQTQQLGWGNAIVLSPTGGNVQFNTVSYDLFRTLQDALLTPWDPATVFPDNLQLIGNMRKQESARVIYRVVKVVAAN